MNTSIRTQTEKQEILPDGGYTYTQYFMTLTVNGRPFTGKPIDYGYYGKDAPRWAEYELCRNAALRLRNFPTEAERFGQPAEDVRRALLRRADELEYAF